MAERYRVPQASRSTLPQQRRPAVPGLAQRRIEEKKQEKLKARHRRRLLIRWMIAIAAMAFVFYGALRLFSELKRYSRTEVLRENKSFKGYEQYTDFGTGVLAYGTNGMCYIEKDGSVLWRTNYNMRDPKVAVNGSYGAVADIAHQDAIIFNTSGITGKASAGKAVLNLAVSSHGVLALAQDEGEGGTVSFYRSDGSALDIRIGTLIDASGYPLEMAMSPSGKRLVIAGAVLGQGSAQTCLTFYDLSSTEADEGSKTTSFSYSGTLFPSIVFFSEDRLCAMGDNRICFFDYGLNGKPSLQKEAEIGYEIVRVLPSETRIGLLMKKNGSEELIFRQYSSTGRRVFDKLIEGSCRQAYYSGKYAVFVSSDKLIAMTSWGRVKYEGEIADPMDWVHFTGERTLLQVCSDKIKELKLS